MPNGIQGNCYLPKCLVVILWSADRPTDPMLSAQKPSCRHANRDLITPQFSMLEFTRDKKIISYLNDSKWVRCLCMCVLASLSIPSFYSLLLLFYHEFKSSQRAIRNLNRKFNLHLQTHTHTRRIGGKQI